jgi:hypothetical protein
MRKKNAAEPIQNSKIIPPVTLWILNAMDTQPESPKRSLERKSTRKGNSPT